MTTLSIFFPLWSRRTQKMCHVERLSDNQGAFAYTQSVPQMLKSVSKLMPCNFCLLSGKRLLTSSFLHPSTVMYKHQIHTQKKNIYIQTGNYIYSITVVNRWFFVAQSPLLMDLKNRRKQGKEFKQPISPAIITQRAQLLQLESSHQERDRVVEQNTSSTCHKFYPCLVCRTQEVNLIYQCPTFMRQKRLLEFGMDCWNRQQWHLLNSLLNNAIQ